MRALTGSNKEASFENDLQAGSSPHHKTADANFAMTADTRLPPVRKLVIDWLDDNHHFGEAEQLIGSDDRSFLENGILDSLGFVQLVLHIENTYRLKVDRRR